MKRYFNPEIWLVERKPFVPEHWLPEPEPRKTHRKYHRPKTETGIYHEVETILRRIEAHRIDLTCTYEDWLKLGFAFASEFGEAGRSYFHRVSRFNGGYNIPKCDRQFDKCLKGRKTGVTIKTFFAAAYDAGVNVKT